jgi:O-antigen/teichoic acid export membrane protein
MINRFGDSFKRFLHNLLAHSFGQVINVTSQIFAVPLYLEYWKKAEYGEWLVLTSIPGLLWTLDNGLAGLAGSRMTVVSGRGDWVQANQIFRNVLLVQSLLSLFVFCVVAFIVATHNISAAFGFSTLSRSEAGSVLLLMIGFMLMGFCVGLLRAAYRASMLEARGVAFSNMWHLTDFLAIVIVLPMGGHPVALACGLLTSISFWVVVMFIDVRRRCPKVEFAFGPVSKTHLRSTLVDGLPIFAGEVAGAFVLQGYPLVVNHLLGASSVVTLTTLRTASRTLFQAVQMVSMASASELSRTYGSKDWEGYVRLLKVLLTITVWAAIGSCLGLTLFGPWVIEKWTLGKVLIDHRIMFLFALSVAFQSCWSACGSILVSTNMHHAFNYVYLGMTLAGLCVVNVLERAFGFLGVPLTMVLVDSVLLGWALHICRTRLTFVALSSLAVVFTPSFYARKIREMFDRGFLN